MLLKSQELSHQISLMKFSKKSNLSHQSNVYQITNIFALSR